MVFNIEVYVYVRVFMYVCQHRPMIRHGIIDLSKCIPYKSLAIGYIQATCLPHSYILGAFHFITYVYFSAAERLAAVPKGR